MGAIDLYKKQVDRNTDSIDVNKQQIYKIDSNIECIKKDVCWIKKSLEKQEMRGEKQEHWLRTLLSNQNKSQSLIDKIFKAISSAVFQKRK